MQLPHVDRARRIAKRGERDCRATFSWRVVQDGYAWMEERKERRDVDVFVPMMRHQIDVRRIQNGRGAQQSPQDVPAEVAKVQESKPAVLDADADRSRVFRRIIVSLRISTICRFCASLARRKQGACGA